MKAQDLTILDVMVEHNIEPKNGSVHCPVHDDQNPSASVNHADDPEGFINCFTCGWNADAIGYKAALEGTSAAEILRSMDRGTGPRPTLKRTPPWKMRRDARTKWAVKSQPYIDDIHNSGLDDWIISFALDELDPIFKQVAEAFHNSELPPVDFIDVVNDALRQVKDWHEHWLDGFYHEAPDPFGVEGL